MDIILNIAIRIICDDDDAAAVRQEVEGILDDGGFEYNFTDYFTLMVQEEDAQEILEILQESNIDCMIIY